MLGAIVLTGLAVAVLAGKKKGVSGVGYAAAHKPFWYGIPAIQFISHGEWSDGELYYKGNYYNAVEADDTMYDEWQYCRDEGYTDLDYENWMRQNGSYVKSKLLDLQPTINLF